MAGVDALLGGGINGKELFLRVPGMKSVWRVDCMAVGRLGLCIGCPRARVKVELPFLDSTSESDKRRIMSSVAVEMLARSAYCRAVELASGFWWKLRGSPFCGVCFSKEPDDNDLENKFCCLLLAAEMGIRIRESAGP